MGHLGFSYIGFIFLLMLIIPNLIWAKHHPKGYAPQKEGRVLLIFERLGQILVTCTALMISAAIFGVGHIGIHLEPHREIRG